ncbi:TIFY domain/Divergent CCT motif family protein isoform X2 [Carex rostrata]
MNCSEVAALVVNETRVEAVTAPTTNARSPLEKPLSELREEDIAQVTREDCRRFLKERGMRRPSWNKSQAIQQVISLKALLEGRPGAGDPPVSSFLLPSKSPHAPTPSHDARSSEKNETSGSGGSVPLPKEPLLSPYRRRDPVLNTPVLDPVPTPRFPPPPENRPATECAPGQLTILYDGQRNVYDGVTPDKAKAIMQLAESSENFYSVPMPTQPSRLPPPRFPASFPGPGGSMPSTPQACCILPPSPTDGNDCTGYAKFPRLCRESTEDQLRPPREIEPEGPKTRQASLQRYLEKRKDRFKGKKILGVMTGTSMDMMYMSHKTMWCQTSNEMRPISPPIPTQCGPQPNHPTKVCLSFDLNDEADED